MKELVTCELYLLTGQTVKIKLAREHLDIILDCLHEMGETSVHNVEGLEDNIFFIPNVIGIMEVLS